MKKYATCLSPAATRSPWQDDRIEWLLSRLREIEHVEFIRMGTKVPAVLPQRITPALTRMLRRYHPLWISIHFMHPNELTPEVRQACERLADAGIPLGSQTVLTRNVNDDVETMKRLVQGLLRNRVRPYYLYQCDPIPRIEPLPHRPSRRASSIIERSARLHDGLRGARTYRDRCPRRRRQDARSGPTTIIGRDGDNLLLRNYQGGVFRYPDPNGQPL
jgi:lysine 2,3-aminomutase